MPEILTIEEAAVLLRITKRAAYRLLAKGQIPGARKLGQNWRFSRSKIEKHFGVTLSDYPIKATEVSAK